MSNVILSYGEIGEDIVNSNTGERVNVYGYDPIQYNSAVDWKVTESSIGISGSRTTYPVDGFTDSTGVISVVLRLKNTASSGTAPASAITFEIRNGSGYVTSKSINTPEMQPNGGWVYAYAYFQVSEIGGEDDYVMKYNWNGQNFKMQDFSLTGVLGSSFVTGFDAGGTVTESNEPWTIDQAGRPNESVISIYDSESSEWSPGSVSCSNTTIDPITYEYGDTLFVICYDLGNINLENLPYQETYTFEIYSPTNRLVKTLVDNVNTGDDYTGEYGKQFTQWIDSDYLIDGSGGKVLETGTYTIKMYKSGELYDTTTISITTTPTINVGQPGYVWITDGAEGGIRFTDHLGAVRIPEPYEYKSKAGPIDPGYLYIDNTEYQTESGYLKATHSNGANYGYSYYIGGTNGDTDASKIGYMWIQDEGTYAGYLCWIDVYGVIRCIR